MKSRPEKVREGWPNSEKKCVTPFFSNLPNITPNFW